MRDVRAVPFQPWHLKLFEHPEENKMLDPETRALVYRSTFGVTLLVGTTILGALVISPLWKGVAEVAFVPGPGSFEHRLKLVRYIKKWDNVVMSALKLRRLQTTVLASNQKHRRFIECFGFNYEGSLRFYSPKGDTMAMYAKVIDE